MTNTEIREYMSNPDNILILQRSLQYQCLNDLLHYVTQSEVQQRHALLDFRKISKVSLTKGQSLALEYRILLTIK